MSFDFENGRENEFKDNNENHAADPEIGFLTKSISKLNGRATAMPTAWELRFIAKFQIFRLVAFFIPLFIES